MNGGTAARAEVVAGVVGLAATRYAAGGVRPPDWELAWFRTVNRLPDSMYRPVWAVMQLGSLGAAPPTAAAALVLGRRRLATPLFVGGTGAWVAAKLMKVAAPRGRPALFLTEFHTRGRAATGGGFPSGHAGVATVLAATAAGTGSRALSAATAATAAMVGTARVCPVPAGPDRAIRMAADRFARTHGSAGEYRGGLTKVMIPTISSYDNEKGA